MNNAKRLQLISEVFDLALGETESFGCQEDRVGESLAYLFGAIAKNAHVSVQGSRDKVQDQAWDTLLSIFEAHLPKEHEVWNFIRFERT